MTMIEPNKATGSSDTGRHTGTLQQVQDEWDGRYDARSIPGRPLD